MALNPQVKLRPVPTDAPPCFQKIVAEDAREVAAEIYETLKSVHLLVPSTDATPDCPAARLGERLANYVVTGAMRGRTFRALADINTSKVKFVGPAAGVLEAARLGALPPLIKQLFFKKIQFVVETMSNSKIATFHPKKVGPGLSRVTNGEVGSVGALKLDKMRSIQFLLDHNRGLTEVWSFRVIEVRFHPNAYDSYMDH